jgi:hypothetical protein
LQVFEKIWAGDLPASRFDCPCAGAASKQAAAINPGMSRHLLDTIVPSPASWLPLRIEVSPSRIPPGADCVRRTGTAANALPFQKELV